MQNYSLAHVCDAVLLRDLVALVARDRITTADLLAHIAEVDARRLYVPAGYSSMHAYCVDELRLSEDAAYKRIQAARAGRQFSSLFAALADGRLHLAGACLLAPHLRDDNAADLIEAASHKRKSAIEDFLAARFGVEPSRVSSVMPFATHQLAPRQVDEGSHHQDHDGDGLGDQLAPGQVEKSTQPQHESRHYLVQVTIPRGTHEKLRYAQSLLSHTLPSGDLAQLFDRALDALILQLEKRKVGSSNPRARKTRTSLRIRHVPAEVRRAVWERDQGRCTFVAANGKRCNARRFLEFDHVEPVARGGTATTTSMRLRCRAHNQYEAERVFGAEFMKKRREGARLAARPKGSERIATSSHTRDVVSGLLHLGCRPGDARRAAEYSANLPLGSLEERMRAALQFLGGRFVQGRSTART